MLFTYIKKWIDVWDYLALEREKKQVTFYSEGKNYWPYLKDIINELTNEPDLSIYYISSDKNDPGLDFKNDRIKKLLVDYGYLRTWFFQKLNTNILVMTMPDLDNYQIKKSDKTKCYIYTHHALNSFSSALRKGAIDNFDIIFCPGPHHVEEVRMLEDYYKLKPKSLVKTGYSKIDVLMKRFIEYKESYTKKSKKKKTILLAPTWGENAIVEIGKAPDLIDSIIDQGFQVVFRPHPETLKHSTKKIKLITEKYSKCSLFTLESNVSRDLSLFESYALVTDWSGIAWEYALALKKPILFYDTPARINNPDYFNLPMASFESKMRSKCGMLWNGKDNINVLIKKWEKIDLNPHDYVYNIGKSCVVASNYIKDLAKQLNKTST